MHNVQHIAAFRLVYLVIELLDSFYQCLERFAACFIIGAESAAGAILILGEQEQTKTDI